MIQINYFIWYFFTLTQVTIQTITFTWVKFLGTIPTSGQKHWLKHYLLWDIMKYLIWIDGVHSIMEVTELWSFVDYGVLGQYKILIWVLWFWLWLHHYSCFRMEEELLVSLNRFIESQWKNPGQMRRLNTFIKTQTRLLMEPLPTKRFQKTYCIHMQSIWLHKRTTVFEQRINPKWCLCVWMELPLFLAMASCTGGQPSPDRRQRKEGDIQGHI